jgi:hypothetical protein
MTERGLVDRNEIATPSAQQKARNDRRGERLLRCFAPRNDSFLPLSLRGFPKESRGNLNFYNKICHCEPAEGGRGNLF